VSNPRFDSSNGFSGTTAAARQRQFTGARLCVLAASTLDTGSHLLPEFAQPAEGSTTLDHRFSIAPMMERTDRHCRFFRRLLTIPMG